MKTGQFWLRALAVVGALALAAVSPPALAWPFEDATAAATFRPGWRARSRPPASG